MTAAALMLLALSACANVLTSVDQEPVSLENGDGDFPYHPLVYHLDLSILAYQLYGQSLVWPFDPYYEEMDNGKGERARTIQNVQSWLKIKGAEQTRNRAGLNAFRGPGVLIGAADNETHDPILYNYSRIDPWSNALTNAAGTWTEYSTPRKITGQIRDVYVCYRPAGAASSGRSFDRVPDRHNGRTADARDILLAFEGGTGDKGEAGQPASQSLMGFVLARQKSAGGYDLHIAFRGSRSGSAGRAVREAFSDGGATGNPDWITDLGYNRLTSGEGGGHISTVGAVHRGFARSMKSILPNLMHCLNKFAGLKKGVSPDNIYVTGHSLGGALAQDFVAAIHLGNQYGPAGTGAKLPASLRQWPWKQIKLVTYGAPRVGDETFARALTVNVLQSEFFSTSMNPLDRKHLKATDTTILPRLLDPARPAGYRVLNSRDPITSEKVAGGKHVGKTIYVNRPSVRDVLPPPDFSAHEQRQIRDYMIGSLSDQRIPALAMRYRQMDEINPERDEKKKGSPAEMRKLVAAIRTYYTNNGIWFDHAAFERDAELRMKIDEGR